MAKDKYSISSVVDIVGTLDYNQNEELVVNIEQGKGDNIIVTEVDIVDVLRNCVGRQITIKLTDEEDKCNGQIRTKSPNINR